jgi:hypothetical protein
MKLPNGEYAIVEMEKLAHYCLDRDHPRGRHKARVFASALGLGAQDAPFLQEQLKAAARSCEAVRTDDSPFGAHYQVDFEVARASRRAVVRSCWIVRGSETVPRLTSCWVL